MATQSVPVAFASPVEFEIVRSPPTRGVVVVRL
jgi:hypothetical protein